MKDKLKIYMLPQILFTDERLIDLSNDSKLLFAILLDRDKLSRSNNWTDKNGKVYIICTIETTQKKLNRSKNKALKAMKELENVNLIERGKIGGKSVIYVKECTCEELDKNTVNNKNKLSTGAKNEPSTVQNLNPNNTYINNTNNNTNKTNTPIGECDKHTDWSEVINIYNNTCISLPQCTTLSNTRTTKIKSILKNHSLEEIEKVFKLAETSNFLTGKVTSFTANFDWIMKSENFLKIIEGNYTNKKISNINNSNNNNKSKNRFCNHNQRDLDFDEIEKLLELERYKK